MDSSPDNGVAVLRYPDSVCVVNAILEVQCFVTVLRIVTHDFPREGPIFSALIKLIKPEAKYSTRFPFGVTCSVQRV